MDERKLRKLPIEYLWEGLVLKEDLYDHSGSVLLLPKGEVITAEKIQRLVNFDQGDKNIMVYEDTFYEILADEHIPPEKRQELTESSSGYGRLQQSVGALFHYVDAWLENDEIELLVQEISQKLVEIDPVVIFSCISFPRPMDEGLQRHSLNVAMMNGMIGEWLGLSRDDIETLVMAGLLHDIGKTQIPEEILNAPRRLTPEEFKIMKRHPVYSDKMLGNQFGEAVRDAARHHHEKLTGDGYPDGLKGDELSLFTRITAVSDIYDAMVSKRSYKEANLPFHVFDMFYEEEFKGLDRKLIMTFLKNMRRQYQNKKVIMSDGRVGKIRYIPVNDAEHPVIEQDKRIEQTSEEWYCTEILTV